MLDRWLKEGIICAGAAQATPLLSAMLSQTSNDTNNKSSANDEVLTARLDMATVLAEHLARSQPTNKQLVALLSTMATGESQLAEAVVKGLGQGWPKDFKPELNDELDQALDKLVSKLPLGARGQLVTLASTWGSEKLKKYAEEIMKDLNGKLNSGEVAVADRLKAATQLLQVSNGSDAVVEQLAAMLTPQNPPQLTSGIVRAMASTRSSKVASVLLSKWESLTPTLREDTVAVLLVRPESTRALIDSMSEGKIRVSDLTLDQRQTLKGHPDRKLRDAATKVLAASGGLPSADRVKVLERYASTAHTKGDAKVGKELFKKSCANCHKHSGEGQEIGPDLTGMAVHPKEELLVHILDPSRSVEGNFRRYTVLTGDGKVIAGMLAAESLSAIEIIDAEGKRQSIARDDVESITATNKSLMPEGLEEQLKETDMTNLLEFLTSKGRFLPLPLASVATAVSTKGLFHDGDNGPDRMIFPDWKSKTFNGVTFQLVDPQGKSKPNIIMLHGPQGTVPPSMPRNVKLPCNMPVGKLHMLSGVSGWGYPATKEGTTTMIVKFYYADGQTEEQKLINGKHFADYIRRVDVPDSQFAFNLRGQQVRYLAVVPQRKEVVTEVELIKGDDASAPMVMAITAEQPQ